MKFPVSSVLFCCFGLSVAATARAQPATPTDGAIANAVAGANAIVALPERRAKIYVGSSDYGGLPTAWEELANPDNYAKWSYVRAHADGFYTNFAMMDHVFAHGASPVQMAVDMAKAFAHKDVFYETDMNYPAAQGREKSRLSDGGQLYGAGDQSELWHQRRTRSHAPNLQGRAGVSGFDGAVDAGRKRAWRGSRQRGVESQYQGDRRHVGG